MPGSIWYRYGSSFTNYEYHTHTNSQSTLSCVHIRSVHRPSSTRMHVLSSSLTYPADHHKRMTFSPFPPNTMSASDDDDDSSTAGDINLFDEPEDWKPKEKPCTFQTYLLEEKNEEGVVTGMKEIKLRLVGSSPLWVSFLLVWSFFSW